MSPAFLIVVDVVLAIGATARLTHAVTVEDIGGRLLRAPATRWANRTDPGSAAERNRLWWADALDCPWCVSTWIALLAVAALTIVHAMPEGWLVAYRIVAGGLTVSWVTAMIQVGFETATDPAPYDDPEPN